MHRIRIWPLNSDTPDAPARKRRNLSANCDRWGRLSPRESIKPSGMRRFDIRYVVPAGEINLPGLISDMFVPAGEIMPSVPIE
jgi:hypothetical protein